MNVSRPAVVALGVVAAVLIGAVVGIAVFGRKSAPSPLPASPRFTTASAIPDCSRTPGFASSCEGGLRVLKTTDPALSGSVVQVSMFVEPSPSEPSLIMPVAYRWSAPANAWQPFTLTGTLYPGSTYWLTGRAWATLTLPHTELLAGENPLIAFEYRLVKGQWAGPACSDASGSPGIGTCWRYAAFQLGL